MIRGPPTTELELEFELLELPLLELLLLELLEFVVELLELLFELLEFVVELLFELEDSSANTSIKTASAA